MMLRKTRRSAGFFVLRETAFLSGGRAACRIGSARSVPVGTDRACILHQLACKIGQGFDWLKDFPSERNNGVYFRARKILQAIKD